MATLHIPVRVPGQPCHPPQLAAHVRRLVAERPDLMGRPTYVRDTWYIDDHDHQRALDSAMLVRHDCLIPPIPTEITYRFPYARSMRGQVQWKLARVRAIHLEIPHAR